MESVKLQLELRPEAITIMSSPWEGVLVSGAFYYNEDFRFIVKCMSINS